MVDFVQHPVIQALAWALVHFMWQGAAIGLLVAIALRLVKNSPSLRYAIGVGALVAMLVAPVTTFFVLSDAPALPVSASASAAPDVRITLGPALQIESSADAAASSAANLRIAPEVLAITVVAWISGVVFFLTRLVGGWMVASRLTRRAVQPAADHIQNVARQMADRLAIHRSVAILQSSAVVVPVMVGWLKPAILLPVAALAGLSPAQLEALLAHELAHVRRHDYLVNLLQSVAEALLFYHPAVWWLSDRVRAERELCCDDLAVGVCDPLVYATALTDLAAMTSPGLALAATDGDLLARVRRILGQSDGAPAVRTNAMPLLALALVAGVAVPVVVASTQVPMPRPAEVIDAKPDAPAPLVTVQGRAVVRTEGEHAVVLEADRVTLQQTTAQTAEQRAEQQRAEELRRKVEELQRLLVQMEQQRVALARDRATVEAQAVTEVSQKAREIEIAAAQRNLAERRRQFEVGLVSEAQLQDAQNALAKAEASGNPQALQSLELQAAQQRLARVRDLVDKGLMSAGDLATMEAQLAQLEQMKLAATRQVEARARRQDVAPAAAQANAERQRQEVIAQRGAASADQASMVERLRQEVQARSERRDVAPEGQPVAANEPVRVGDYVRIDIDGEDMRMNYRVGDEGTIKLPLIGAIKIVGLTAAQVRDAVGKQLAAHKLKTVEQVKVTLTRASRR